MGDWGTESGQPYDPDTWSRPAHKVTLDGFSMMAYKVTYEDFDIFIDGTGNERIDMDEFSIEDRAPKRPAGVSWYGAKAYCKWLGERTRLPFDLPTEAQWEYAARSGGKRVLFATDNGKVERPRNFPKEWTDEVKEPALPDVGSYPPNPAGLLGMSENTGEWVNDWFDENYYKVSPEKNPLGPSWAVSSSSSAGWPTRARSGMAASRDRALIVNAYPSLMASSPRTHSASKRSGPSGVLRRSSRVVWV